MKRRKKRQTITFSKGGGKRLIKQKGGVPTRRKKAWGGKGVETKIPDWHGKEIPGWGAHTNGKRTA